MKEILKEVGLTNNEVEVYLTLLKTGSVTVNTVAEKSGLHRQACYDALDRLLEKGFASFVIQNGKKHFQGVHPEKISEYIEEKREKFKSILPELLEISQIPREDTFVEVYKGKGVLRTLYHDIIHEFTKEPGEILLMGIDDRKFMDEDRIALIQHLKKLRKLNCHERVLISEDNHYFVDGKQTTYRHLPRHSFHPTPMEVYGNNFAIITWGNPNHIVIIRNKELADAYRRQFEVLWKIASPRRQAL